MDPNAWLADACARKQLLYLTFINNSSIQNKTNYNKLLTFCRKHVTLDKDKYFLNYFEQYKDNSRKPWQMLNELLNRNNINKTSKIDKITSPQGLLLSSNIEIANEFNTYFSNIPSNIKSSEDDFKSLAFTSPSIVLPFHVLN